MSDAVKVAIRVRPLIQREASAQSEIQWTVEDKCIRQVAGSKPAYVFDAVFDQPCTTEDVYDELGVSLLDNVMQGFHGTIFAYGQTASGKTHTMMGNAGCPGIIPRAMEDIFLNIETTENREFLIRVSYLEIYNENVVDLLSEGDIKDKKSLEVREDRGGQVFVANIKEVMVTSAEEIIAVMTKGEVGRHFGVTNMNERSSRSHTIFRVVIESREARKKNRQSEDGSVMVSHLNLVDLAGSEKAKQTGAMGARLVEGGFINKSLTTLGQVISQLSDGASFVSYRDSKLTRILQNALGGNSKTVIICNVTPASLEETHSTLRFATSAKRIKNKPIQNEVLSDEALLKRYRKEISKLQKQLNQVRDPNLDPEELLQRLAEKERQEQEQEERINQLQKFVISSTRMGDAGKKKQKRRMTWCPRQKAGGLPAAIPADLEIPAFKKPQPLLPINESLTVSSERSPEDLSVTTRSLARLDEETEEDQAEITDFFDLNNSCISGLQKRVVFTSPPRGVDKQSQTEFEESPPVFKLDQNTEDSSHPPASHDVEELMSQVEHLTLQVCELEEERETRAGDGPPTLGDTPPGDVAELTAKLERLERAAAAEKNIAESEKEFFLEEIHKYKEKSSEAATELQDLTVRFENLQRHAEEEKGLLEVERDFLVKEVELLKESSASTPQPAQDVQVPEEVTKEIEALHANVADLEKRLAAQKENSDSEREYHVAEICKWKDLAKELEQAATTGSSTSPAEDLMNELDELRLNFAEMKEESEAEIFKWKNIAQELEQTTSSVSNSAVSEEVMNELEELRKNFAELQEESQKEITIWKNTAQDLEQSSVGTSASVEVLNELEELRKDFAQLKEESEKEIAQWKEVAQELEQSISTGPSTVSDEVINELEELRTNFSVYKEDTEKEISQWKTIAQDLEQTVTTGSSSVASEEVMKELEELRLNFAELKENSEKEILQWRNIAEELEQASSTEPRSSDSEISEEMTELRRNYSKLKEESEKEISKWKDIAQELESNALPSTQGISDITLSGLNDSNDGLPQDQAVSLRSPGNDGKLRQEAESLKSQLLLLQYENEALRETSSSDTKGTSQQAELNSKEMNELMNLSEDLMKENGDLRKAKEKLEQSLISCQSTLEVLQGEHDEIVDAHKALIEFTQLETDFRNASLAGDSAFIDSPLARLLTPGRAAIKAALANRSPRKTPLASKSLATGPSPSISPLATDTSPTTSPLADMPSSPETEKSPVMSAEGPILAETRQQLEEAELKLNTLQDELEALKTSQQRVENEKNDLAYSLDLEREKSAGREKELREQLEELTSKGPDGGEQQHDGRPPSDDHTDAQPAPDLGPRLAQSEARGAELDAQVAQLEVKIDSLKAEKSALAADMNEQIDIAIDTQGELVELKQANTRLQAELDEANTTLAETPVPREAEGVVTGQHEDKTDLIASLEREKSQLLDQQKALETERESLLCQLQELADKVKLPQNDDQSELAAAHEEEKRQLRDQQKALEAEKESLLSQLQETADDKLKNDNQSELVASLEKEINQLQEQQKLLEAEKESLQSQLREMADDKLKISMLEKDLQDAADQLGSFKNTVTLLEKRLSRMARESLAPQQGGGDSNLEQRLRKEQEEHMSLREQYDQLQSSSAQTRDQLLSGENRDLDLQRRIDAMERTRRDLEEVFSRQNKENQELTDKLNKQVYELSCQLQKSQSEEELATHKLSKMDAEVKSLKEELRFLEDSVRDKPRPSLGRQEMDPDKMADRIKKLGVSLDLNNQRCQKYELQLKELKVVAEKGEDAMLERDVLQRAARDTDRRLREASEELSAVRQRYSSSFSELATLRGQVDSTQARLEQSAAQLASTEDQLRGVTEERGAQDRSMGELREQLRDAEHRHADTAAQLKQAEAEVGRLQAEGSDLRDQLSCLDALQQERAALARDLAALRGEMEAVVGAKRAELGELEQERDTLLEKLEVLSAELSQTQQKVQDTEVRHQTQSTQLENLQATSTGLAERLKEADAAKEALTQQLEDADTATQALNMRLEEAEGAKESLTQQLQEADGAKKALEQKLQDLEATRVELAEELSKTKAEAERLKDEQTMLEEREKQRELVEMTDSEEKTELETKMRAIDEERLANQDRVEALTSEMEELKAELETTMAAKLESQQNLDILSQELETVKAAAVELEEMKKEFNQLESSREETQQNYDKLTKELDLVKASQSASSMEIQASEEALMKELDGLKIERDELKTRVEETEKNIEDQSAQLACSSSEKNELQAKIEAIDEKRLANQERVETLTAEMEELKAELETTRASKLETQQNLDTASQELEAVKAATVDLEELKIKLNQSESSKEEMQQNYDKLTKELDLVKASQSASSMEIQASEEALMKELDGLKIERDQLKTRVEETEKNIEDQSAKLVSLNTDLEEVQSQKQSVQEKLESLAKEVEELKAEKEELIKMVEEAESLVVQLDTDKNNQELALLEAREKLTNLQVQLKDVEQNKAESLEGIQSSMTAELEKKNTLCEKLEAEASDLRSLVETCTETIQSRTRDVEEAQSQLQQAKTDQALLQEQLDELRAVFRDYDRELEVKGQSSEATERRLREAEDLARIAEEDLRTARGELEAAKLSQQQLEAEVSRLSQRALSQDAEVSRLSQRALSQDAERQETEALLSALTTEADGLKVENRALQGKIESAESLMESLKSGRSEQESCLQQQAEVVCDLEAKLQELEQSSQKQIHDLEKTRVTLSDQLANKDSAYHKLSVELAALRAEAVTAGDGQRSVTDEMERLRAQVTTATADKELLEDQVDQMKSVFSDYDKELKDATARLEAANSKVKVTADSLKVTEEQLEVARMEYEALSASTQSTITALERDKSALTSRLAEERRAEIPSHQGACCAPTDDERRYKYSDWDGSALRDMVDYLETCRCEQELEFGRLGDELQQMDFEIDESKIETKILEEELERAKKGSIEESVTVQVERQKSRTEFALHKYESVMGNAETVRETTRDWIQKMKDERYELVKNMVADNKPKQDIPGHAEVGVKKVDKLSALQEIESLEDAISSKAEWIEQLKKDREELQQEINTLKATKKTLKQQLASTAPPALRSAPPPCAPTPSAPRPSAPQPASSGPSEEERGYKYCDWGVPALTNMAAYLEACRFEQDLVFDRLGDELTQMDLVVDNNKIETKILEEELQRATNGTSGAITELEMKQVEHEKTRTEFALNKYECIIGINETLRQTTQDWIKQLKDDRHQLVKDMLNDDKSSLADSGCQVEAKNTDKLSVLGEIESLNDAISDKADWIQKLEKDREEVQREIDATRDAKEALAEQLAATAGKVSIQSGPVTPSSTASANDAQLASLQKLCTERQSRLAAMRTESERMTEQHRHEVARLTESLRVATSRDLPQEMIDLAAKVKKLSEENFQFKLRNNSLETEIIRNSQPLKDKIASLKETNTYLEQKLTYFRDLARQKTNNQQDDSMVCVCKKPGPAPRPSAPSGPPAGPPGPPLPAVVGSGVVNQMAMFTLEAENKALEKQVKAYKAELQREQGRRTAEAKENAEKMEKFKQFYKKQLTDHDRQCLRDLVNSPQKQPSEWCITSSGGAVSEAAKNWWEANKTTEKTTAPADKEEKPSECTQQ